MKTKKDYLTLISVVSAFAVLLLHTNNCFWSFNPTERYWKTANIIECVNYFAVPLFFMISGITLIDFREKYTLKTYFIKRIKKTVSPFVFWNFVALAYLIKRDKVEINQINLKFIYQGICNSKLVSIFWFFGPLFIIYLCMRLFGAIDKSKRKEIFTYLVILGGILNILIPFLFAVFWPDLTFPYSIRAVGGYLYWIRLGWILDNTEFTGKQRCMIYLGAIVGLVLHIVGTYNLSMEAGKIVETYKGYENLPSGLYAAGMFVFLKQVGLKCMNGKKGRFINWLGKYTFPIYLIQVFLLWEVRYNTSIDVRSITYRLGAPFVMIPIIIIFTACLRKIPIVKNIVP